MEKEKTVKFYPNVEYNQKKRNKYFVMFTILTVLMLMMDAWFITEEFYVGLIMNAFIVLFIVLTPKTLKENPVKRIPVLEITDEDVTVMDKTIRRSEISAVKGIVYLGSIGNPVENREFLEKCAAGKPLEEMLGSIEVVYRKDGKAVSEFAVIENVTEALMIFVKEGKVEYRLGYSLGKEYRVSTYNLKETANEQKETPSQKSKMKQII